MSRPFVLETTMTQERIDLWAELSGDVNPLHVDAEYAAAARFGGPIAHGHIALSLFEHLMLTARGERWLHGGELVDVRFRSPVRPGRDHRVTAAPVETAEGEAEAWELEVRDAKGHLCVEGRARLEAGGRDGR